MLTHKNPTLAVDSNERCAQSYLLRSWKLRRATSTPTGVEIECDVHKCDRTIATEVSCNEDSRNEQATGYKCSIVSPWRERRRKKFESRSKDFGDRGKVDENEVANRRLSVRSAF